MRPFKRYLLRLTIADRVHSSIVARLRHHANRHAQQREHAGSRRIQGHHSQRRPAQQQKLQNLPPGKVTMTQKGWAKPAYIFPDPAHNRAYVGGPRQYPALSTSCAPQINLRQESHGNRRDVPGCTDAVEFMGRLGRGLWSIRTDRRASCFFSFRATRDRRIDESVPARVRPKSYCLRMQLLLNACRIAIPDSFSQPN